MTGSRGWEQTGSMTSIAEHAFSGNASRALPLVRAGLRTVADMECLTTGVFSPLQGFMTRSDYVSVIHSMRLSSGAPWTLPVTLSASDDEVASIGTSDEVVVVSQDEPVAIVEVEEIFDYEAELEAELVFRTIDANHPGVASLYSQGAHYIAGRVSAFRSPHSAHEEYRLTPNQTAAAIGQRGWKSVAGFQTRNPIHRAHEYLTKCALEIADGLLLHPLIGETKHDDVPVDVRMLAYRALLDRYYPLDRVLLSVFPAAMRYAGPREAVFHAICRKNYGCTHFIVGRDHAGVGDYYGTFDAHHIFDEFDADELGITPLFFDHAFWCNRCGHMATTKTCPHRADDRISLSGTEVRRRLQSGEDIPTEFSRPEVAAVLREYVTERG